MRLVRPLLGFLCLATPGHAAAPPGDRPTSFADPSARAAEQAWTGIFYRCPGEASARRVIASVRDRRPASAEVALPFVLQSVGREACVEVGDQYEWTHVPVELEFEEDGQGLQLIMGKEADGRPLALVYRRGAC